MPATGAEPIESRVSLPARHASPIFYIGRRVAIALALLVFVALVAYFGRDGYVDVEGGGLSLLDAFYYATVSVTTTGYGDIRPATEEARLISTIFVTPARVLFLIVLVGTTLEILAERTRTAFRVARWRSGLNGHVVICGYGTKGRSAARSLRGHGVRNEDIVVIDESPDARAQAESEGLATIAGDAARAEVLEAAGIRTARSVIVAAQRDDTAVLITLTARELNATATIAAAVREEENAHLLRQSGATSVIVSSGAAGRLLGVATETPKVVEVLEDLLTVGHGLDLVERPVGPDETGPIADLRTRSPVIAVIRGDEVLRFDDERAAELEPGDRIVQLEALPTSRAS
jgi:voltage-gated potassium channel